jgi:hypothetical protein
VEGTPAEEDVRDKYDPDQPVEERQQVRKSMRDLQREIAGTWWI